MNHNRLLAVFTGLAVVAGLLILFHPNDVRPSFRLPTLTPVASPTPLPPRPRPGYTAVPEDVSAPSLIGQSPLPGEEVAPGGDIRLVFDHDMDRASVETAFQIYPDTPGTFDWQNDQNVIFHPVSQLTRAGVYDVVIDQRAQDRSGAPLNQAYQFRFATAGFLEVAQVIPAPGTVDAEPGSAVTVIFNRPVVPLAIGSEQTDLPQPVSLSVAGAPITGTGEWIGSSVYVFHPAQPLPGGVAIDAAVSGGLIDSDGNPMHTAYVWQFAVAPLHVVNVAPADRAIQVPIETAIVLQFSQPLDLDAARRTITLRSAYSADVALDFGLSGQTLTLTPTTRLDFDMVYRLQIAGELSGALGEEYVTSFRTVPLPKIIATFPAYDEPRTLYGSDFAIQFNTPIDPASVMPHLTWNPPLSATLVQTYYRAYNGQFIFDLQFGAQPGSEHEVVIAPGIKDPYGNETQDARTVRFRSPDLLPDIYLRAADLIGTYNAYDPARLYIAHTNIADAHFDLYRLPADDILVSRVKIDTLPPPTALIRSWSQHFEPAPNRIRTTAIDLVEGGGRLEPGVYLLAVESPQRPKLNEGFPTERRHVLIVSPIHLTFKLAAHEALVWATDYQSGQPAPGVPVTLYDYAGRALTSATTDAQGIARFQSDEPLTSVAGAASTSTFAAAADGWSQGITTYDFGLSGRVQTDPESLKTYVYTDRPLYRPGQTVHFKGIVRSEKDVAYSLPAGVRSAHILIRGADSDVIFDQELDVSASGAFHGELSLSDGASIGSYGVYQSMETRSDIPLATFSVAAYRPPEFQVNVTPADDEIVAGQSTQVTVDAGYFFGGGLANTPVDWQVLAEPYTFQPPWGGRYIYRDTSDLDSCFDCWWRSGYVSPQPIHLGSGTTDAAGQFRFEIPGNFEWLNGQPVTESLGLTVEAYAYGPDNQRIAGRATLTRHAAEFYVGLQTRDSIGEAGKPSTVDLIAADWQGARLPNRAIDVSVTQREWVNTFVENETGSGHWQSEPRDTPVVDTRVTTNPQGEAHLTFTPPHGGSYRISATAADSAGRPARASLVEWVTDQTFVSWRRENNDRITLVSDKTSYRLGETARILIPSPYQGEHWALVTLERGSILRHTLLKIDGHSPIYELPITPDLVPNVYVSVVLIKGQDATNLVSDYKVGLLPIDVPPVEQQLHVSLQPDRTSALPGESVTYQVRVTSNDGAPIQAELSLDLVDKAVLTLQPRPPDAIGQAFYGRRPLGVDTASSLAVSDNRIVDQLAYLLEQRMSTSGASLASILNPRLTQAYAEPLTNQSPVTPAPTMTARAQPTELAVATPSPAQSTYGFYDGLSYASIENSLSALQDIEVREAFADTAYWNPAFTTDVNGRGSVTVELPDNLTTWTFRGAGITADTQVGEATVDVVAAKPLLVRPVTPRFFVAGDKAELAANVTNNTGEALSVTVTLSATGVTLTSAVQQQITVDAHSEGRATWRVQVQDVESVQLAFVAQSGELSDASKPRLATGPDGSLKVIRYAAPDIAGAAGQLTAAGQRTELVALPAKYDDRQGELAIQVDPSLAAATVDGLDYLEHYPYECTEQTVSRFLPNVLTYRALADLGISNPELEAKLPDLVQQGLNKLYVQQDSEGGWGWWADSESSIYLTAYVVYGLQQARDAGFDVQPQAISLGEFFLGASLNQLGPINSFREANQRASILFVLAEDGRAPADRLDAAFDARDQLSHYARAFLAMALARVNPSDPRIQTLLADLNNAAILSATGVHWEEDNYDWWAMDTDTRSTAIILSALVRLDPNNPLVPNVVRWLMVARKAGVWQTTQETALALIALTDWMRLTGELQPDYDYAVFFNDASQAEGHFSAGNVRDGVKLKVAVRDLLSDVGNRLTFARGDGAGRLYYTAHLKVYLPVEEIEPVDRGISVSRRYTLASCEETNRNECPEVNQVKVGDVIRVDLTIIARHDLYYAVVEDPLPAGAEAIDRGLATTSLLEQAPGSSAAYDHWWNWYSRSELRDEKVVLFSDHMAPGTYEYAYTLRATLPGEYRVIPTVAQELYFPEVFGRGAGRLLSIEP